MKKSIFVTIIASMCCFAANAQQDYYANHDTVLGTDVIYKVKSSHSTYRISNITNTRDNVDMQLLDGTPAPPPYELYQIFPVGDFRFITRIILLEVFTAEEIMALTNNREHFNLHYIVEPDGHVAEITFQFSKHPLLYSISPDKWYAIEQKIKQRISYTLSPKAQTCAFLQCMHIWAFHYLF